MALIELDDNTELWHDLQKICEKNRAEDGFEERKDRAWRFAVENYKSSLEDLKLSQQVVDEMRKELIELAGSQNSIGCGVKVQKITRAGHVDYSAIGVLKDVDLELYRKPSSESWRITVDEQ